MKGITALVILFLFFNTTIVASLSSDPIYLLTKKNDIMDNLNNMNDGPMESPWPMFGHDNRHTSQSPYSTSTNLGGIKWKYGTSYSFESSAAIDNNGTIYVGSSSGYLHAFYPNGTQKWLYGTGAKITSSPAIHEDGTIYVGSWDCGLYAINPDGTLKWRFSIGGWGESSPAIAKDGTIYIGSVHNGQLYAVNPNGTEKWHFQTGDCIFSSPTIDQSGIIYITSCDQRLYAFYPNGTVKWTVGATEAGAPSIGDDGTIYVSSWNHLTALYPNGTAKWSAVVEYGNGRTPSIADDGIIYVGGDELYAFYPNGTKKWTYNPGRFYDVTTYSCSISADGTIFFGVSNDTGAGGYLIAVNPDGTEKWREWIHNEMVRAIPAIGTDGTVYIGASSWPSESYFYAFNGKKFEDPVIVKPKPGMLYLFNHEWRPTWTGNTLCIGKITIEVSHPDPTNVSRVEIWVDGIKQCELTSPPYQWTWTNRTKFSIPLLAHTINVAAVNRTGMIKYTGMNVSLCNSLIKNPYMKWL